MKKQPPEIRILTDDVANKIAAGEVVERPAAVVKELLENSIDAGATRVEIQFRHGGKTFIKVADDGCGMTRQQALTSLEQHATSKIRAPEDLFEITSYGFRGEAVPSIASVSRFVMRTKPEAQVVGTEIDVYAGTVNAVRDCGMASGTEITVENLFCSVPARRKFLKSDNVEASHIIRLCRLYALALPDLSITLTENARVVFRSERDLKILDRLERVLGAEISSKMFELGRVERGGMSVEGAVLRAGESFPTSRNICAFVNGRPVECRAVYSAVKEAYSQFVPKGRFAAAYIFIKLDPKTVDVNVHPAKLQVRLKDEFGVRDFLFEAISEALRRENARLADFGKSDSAASENFRADADVKGAGNAALLGRTAYASLESDIRKTPFVPRPAFSPRDDFPAPAKTFVPRADALPERRSAASTVPTAEAAQSADEPDAPDDIPPTPAENAKPRAAEQPAENASAAARTVAEDWRYLGCFKKRYALFETAKGLVLMSISAALRRVRYEEVLRSLRGGETPSQTLLIPLPLKFERGDDEYFSANRKAFESCGFAVEDFGRAFYRITAAPLWLKYGDVENFVRDFVELAREENRTLKKAALSEENFAKTLVGRCGAANFECDAQSATALLTKLLGGNAAASSPDGLPTLKEISEAEIARMFCR